MRIRRIACVGIALACLGASPTHAAESAYLDIDSPYAPSATISSGTLIALAALGGASILSKQFEDDERMARLLDGSPIDGAMDIGNVYGDGVCLGASTLCLMLAGRMAGNHDAYALAGTSPSLSPRPARSSGRSNSTRPNGGPYSFPSGHTAVGFSIEF
ncbi:MAG: hypothetical protein JW876_05300 [Candidatus Krumholzibacteriota bacterium]|nr:hypothetical protein [Candidatus Krumholzibacteriota bacterium]